ncbi:MAG: hypothetical protein QM796_18105 [Chthoniobacteraceae bacterium]
MPSRVRPRGKLGLGKFHVAPERVVDALGLADIAGGRADRINLAAEDQMLDPALDLVVELVAVAAEELDTVVLVGIVRGAEHDARIRAERAGDVGHARGG